MVVRIFSLERLTFGAVASLSSLQFGGHMRHKICVDLRAGD